MADEGYGPPLIASKLAMTGDSSMRTSDVETGLHTNLARVTLRQKSAAFFDDDASPDEDNGKLVCYLLAIA